jgi:hypothetical protein
MTRYVAYMATSPNGEMVLAIAHVGRDGRAVIDEVKALTVAGGDAGIDEVYRGMRDQGIEVYDGRADRAPADRDGDVRERAVAGALRLAVEQ